MYTTELLGLFWFDARSSVHMTRVNRKPEFVPITLPLSAKHYTYERWQKDARKEKKIDLETFRGVWR